MKTRLKILFAFCFVLLGFTNLFAQERPQPVDTSKVYTAVQQQATFAGDMNKYLANNIVYPKRAKKKKIEGTVFVSFIVEKDGSVSNVKVIKSVKKGKSLEREALRVVTAMPKWMPGMQDGKIVRVQYVVPIKFILN